MTRPIRLLVVDDSAICRDSLRSILEQDADLSVVAEAADVEAAIRCVEESDPGLVVVDLKMPGRGGLALVEHVMAAFPRPMLLVTGDPSGGSPELSFEALRRGALDVATKPSRIDREACAALREKVRRLASVRVVRHMRPVTLRPAEEGPGRPPVSSSSSRGGAPVVVGIAASAGGPHAVVSVLRAFKPSLGCVVALVQHLPPGFSSAFCGFLSQQTAWSPRLVEGVVVAEPGQVLLCECDVHLQVRSDGKFHTSSAAPELGHRPSANVLLRSLANVYGHRAVGVILSGMGRDGVDGLRALRDRGATTLAQDRATSAVWGMPRAAVEEGAASRELALEQIAPTLQELVRSRQTVAL